MSQIDENRMDRMDDMKFVNFRTAKTWYENDGVLNSSEVVRSD